MRPMYSPIYAFSPSYDVCRRLTINWGTEPVHLPFDTNPNRTIAAAQDYLIAKGLVKHGEHLVIVSDVLAGESTFASIQLRTVGAETESFNA
jgi:pyruvate kinase